MYIEYCIINAIVINDMLHINERNLDTHDNSTIVPPLIIKIKIFYLLLHMLYPLRI